MQLTRCSELTEREVSQPAFNQGPRGQVEDPQEWGLRLGHPPRRSRLSSSTPDDSSGRPLAELSGCEPPSVLPWGSQSSESLAWKGTYSGHKREESQALPGAKVKILKGHWRNLPNQKRGVPALPCPCSQLPLAPSQRDVEAPDFLLGKQGMQVSGKWGLDRGMCL